MDALAWNIVQFVCMLLLILVWAFIAWWLFR